LNNLVFKHLFLFLILFVFLAALSNVDNLFFF
jgi:hypothetical protein